MTRFQSRPILAASILSLASLAAVPQFASADDDAADKKAKKSEKAPASAPATKPAEPQSAKAKKGDLKLEVRAEAPFQAIDPHEVKTDFKAYAGPLVIKSIAEPNAVVRKDQPILTFDRTWIDWGLAAAEGELAVARATLTKAETDAKLAETSEALALRQTEDALKNAESAKKWFEDVEGPQMLLMADLMVKQSQNSLDDQTDELDQLRKMYDGEELTTATADIVVRRAIRSLEQAKVLLKVQQERRDKARNLEFPITRQRVLDSVEQARTGLAALKAQQAQTAVTRSAGLRAAKVAVEQANKKLADLKSDAEQFQFRAPYDGVVAYGNMVDGVQAGGDPENYEVGDKLPAGQVLMRVYQPGKLRLEVSLPESQAFWVEKGDTARITPATLPQTSYTGTTSAVEVQPKGQSGMAFVTNIDLEDVDARLIPGMKATVVIHAAEVKDALLIPLSAVNDGKVKVKNEDGETEEKEVELGKTDGQQVEVLSGLKEGDEIVK